MSRVVCETGLVGADDAEAMDPRPLEAAAGAAGRGAQGDEEVATQRSMTSPSPHL